MKGFMLKVTIMLILTLPLLLVFAPQILSVADEAVRRGVFLQTEEITGIINVLQSSPSGTSHIYLLQKGECELKIDELTVNFTVGKQSIVREIISHIAIEGTSIKCEKAEDKTIYFKRCGDKVFLDEKSRECS